MASDETQRLANHIRAWAAEQNEYEVGTTLTALASLHDDDLRLLAQAILNGGWSGMTIIGKDSPVEQWIEKYKQARSGELRALGLLSEFDRYAHHDSGYDGSPFQAEVRKALHDGWGHS